MNWRRAAVRISCRTGYTTTLPNTAIAAQVACQRCQDRSVDLFATVVVGPWSNDSESWGTKGRHVAPTNRVASRARARVPVTTRLFAYTPSLLGRNDQAVTLRRKCVKSA